MIIKLTESCNMGCIHCFSDCVPCDKHMTFETFKKAIDFWKKFSIRLPIIISGGEPTENPEFENFMSYAVYECNRRNPSIITVTTNGEYISNHPEIVEKFPSIMFQIVIDDRYYPRHVNTEKIEKYKNVLVCHDVNDIYPMGRALVNKIPPSNRYKTPKCFNMISITKQLSAMEINPYPSEASLFEQTILALTLNKKFCVPQIDYDGSIKLGESALCPACSNIDKSFNEISEDILRFTCAGCRTLKDNMPDNLKKLID